MKIFLSIVAFFHLTNLSTFVASASSQPNILFVLVDDLGWSDVGFHGSKIKTPNVDKLASEGVVLDSLRSTDLFTHKRSFAVWEISYTYWLATWNCVHTGLFIWYASECNHSATKAQRSWLTAHT
ncbi:hypothetical protein OS493_010208 [Desmophyllum pertusum]|uniref:Sulfatase N-terminal domain-containing protein n=1 Tax=Desmophyllum pertusum TaxID=174260 RepID=A0A9X0DAH3_9CNID|nr:hypothetical protein OS493_010208 [Desmophyllum pertusum]